MCIGQMEMSKMGKVEGVGRAISWVEEGISTEWGNPVREMTQM